MAETIPVDQNQDLKKDRFENEYIKMWKEKNILYCVFGENLELDYDKAKQCVDARINFSEGKSYPCLIDMRNVKAMSKAAREYLAVEGSQYVTAGALIIGSPLTRTLGNIFLSINKPQVPTKLFSDETIALKWLNEFIKN